MCDTFVSIVPGNNENSVIFGKNSDREPNEAQALEFYPAASYSLKEKVYCTYLSLPQVKDTYAVIISRPFWMWGAEMGINEKGVVIGNEAVFTKMSYSSLKGLTGMDLLRLALERAGSAIQALEVIVDLLAYYGQGGICGFNNKKLTYHNSFIIADQNEAWVLETADYLWVAKKVTDYYSISNRLTIGSEYDKAHPAVIEIARNKGWLKKGKDFHFAETYSDWLYSTFSAASTRQADSYSQTSALLGKSDLDKAFSTLRSHKTMPYNPKSHWLQNSICAHAGNGITRDSNTNGSMVVHLRNNNHIIWATGTSAPCTSLFKPIWFGDKVLPDLGPMPKGLFNSKSYWWYHERFHRMLLRDFSKMELFEHERDQIQADFIKKAYRLNDKGQYDYTCQTFQEAREFAKKWYYELKNAKPTSKRSLVFDRYWKKQNEQAQLEI